MFACGQDFGHSVAIQPDGKILITGTSGNGPFLLRYNPGFGGLDSSFNADGIMWLPFNVGMKGLTVQSDGSIIVAGGSSGDAAVARIRANGTLDSTFGSGGSVKTSIGTGSDSARSAAFDQYGRLVLGGSSHNGTNSDFALVRFDNTIDNIAEDVAARSA